MSGSGSGTAHSGSEMLDALASGAVPAEDLHAQWTALSTSVSPELVQKALDLLLTFTPSQLLTLVQIASSAQNMIAHFLAKTLNYSAVIGLYKQLEIWSRSNNLEFAIVKAIQEQINALAHTDSMHNWVKAASMVETLLTEAKKDASTALIRTHLLAAEVFTRVKHYSKARSHVMSARAMDVKLAPDTHARMDFVSGCVCLCSDDYSGAAGYYQEASNLGYPCVSQLLLIKILQQRFFEIDVVLQGRRKYATPEKIARFPQWMIDVDNTILPKMRRLGLLLTGKINKITLRQLTALIDEILAVKNASFEVYTAVQLLKEREILNFIVHMLRPYKRVELSYVFEFLNMSESDAKAFLSQLIINGDLPFVMDEGDGNLIRIESSQSSNTEFIAEAHKTVEMLGTLFNTCIAKSRA